VNKDVYSGFKERDRDKGAMPFPKLGPNEFQEAMWRL